MQNSSPNSSPIENSSSSQSRSEDRADTPNSQRNQDPESTSNTPRNQAQDAESDPNSPPNISTVIAVESGVGSRSSSFRNLCLPLVIATSAVGLGCSAVIIAGELVYPSNLVYVSNATNASLARVREYDLGRQDDISQFYQNAMIPIVVVGLGALAFQQARSYMQRNGSIGPRRQMIECERAISADLVFNHPDTPEQTNSTNPDRPNSSVDNREGDGLISSPAPLASFPINWILFSRPPPSGR